MGGGRWATLWAGGIRRWGSPDLLLGWRSQLGTYLGYLIKTDTKKSGSPTFPEEALKAGKLATFVRGARGVRGRGLPLLRLLRAGVRQACACFILQLGCVCVMEFLILSRRLFWVLLGPAGPWLSHPPHHPHPPPNRPHAHEAHTHTAINTLVSQKYTCGCVQRAEVPDSRTGETSAGARR